jgi:glutamine amidotransferase
VTVRVAVLDYGMGNLRSVAKAVERVGGEAAIAADAEEVRRADALVVPGVGAFGACVGNLQAAGLDGVIKEFLNLGRPMLGVCLGMQVLFETGEEGGARPGLGILHGTVARLPVGVKVPHMGWNQARWVRDHPLLAGIPSGTSFYFVHSYACFPADDEVVVGETDYGTRFASAVARGNLFATQFHPEKSGDAGLEIYRNLIKEIS